MKRIAFIMPIDYMRGNLSGGQLIEYDGGTAYSIADGERISADDYQPRLIAQVRRLGKPNAVRTYQVRTRSTVNMTNAMRLNLALMGGAGAIFAAIVSDKTSAIYSGCVTACPRGLTLRSFIMPIVRSSLAAKAEYINIASGVVVTNPWIHDGEQTLAIPKSIILKFNSVLSR